MMSKNNHKAPKITQAGRQNGKGKKVAAWAAALVGIALVLAGGFLLFGNNYKHHALEFKKDAMLAARMATIILNDYQDNWIRVETDQLGTNAKGELVSTEDAAQVLQWRSDFYKQNGGMATIDRLEQEMNEHIGKMNITPAKFRDTKDCFTKAQRDVNALIALVRQPGDSLLAMATAMDSLAKGVNDDLEPTDFNFWLTYDDLRETADRLMPDIQDKQLAETFAKATSYKPNSAVNGLKYRKMGFRPLPKGKGVLYQEITPAKGQKPKDDAQVRLHYEGTLMDGTVFDSSYKRGQPAVMRPSQTVAGFHHALTQMPVGAKWQVYIPYDQAYGERAAGAVKPYSDLLFTIEVLGIE